ncbi:MAG: Acyl-CoA dehydrogenase, N-terminal domain [Hydrocarboniphaga sp.]|uniref:acyl-CoA dehydrogenase domain-containing protein n=1 Tax=Hydrocarboniphaga sp. TaxID=2033016 RepID=UPI002611F9A6|nr:acyl-CoA dehydrogenase domain-containing protein [Hydrocarboniphaga sp.]MDB5972965.1 Acyl-CoA dehydrogenase, N-terminal domain [Hydrocarboniphaga sp.]
MLWLLLFLTTSLALAWHRAGLRLTTAAYAALLLAYGVFGGSLALFGLGLLIFAGVFVPLSLPTLREEWLTRPLLDHFQRRLLSLRGEPARAADSVSAAANRLMFDEGSAPLPVAPAMEIPAADAAQSRVPRLPTALGGSGLDARGLRRLLLTLASDPRNLAAAQRLVLADASAQIVLQHASEAQRAALLPQLAAGHQRIRLATDSRWGAGSDRGVIGRGVWKGRETLGLLMDFDVLIDDALSADEVTDYLIPVRVSDPESLLQPEVAGGVALVRVPATLSGLQRRRVGAHSLQLGARQLFVCLERVVGESAGIGCGDTAMHSLQIALAAGRLAIRSAEASAALRGASLDLRLADFYRLPCAASSSARRALVESALDAYGLDTLSLLLARLLDAGLASPHIAALADRAGAGLDIEALAGSLLPKIQACFSAAAAKPYGVALPLFDAAFWDGLGEVLSHQTHAGLQALSDGRIGGGIGRHRQHLERYRAALACCGDALLLERAAVNNGGAAETALAETYAQTLSLVAALQAHVDAGLPRNDEPLLDAYCERCCRRIEEALDSFVQSQRRRRRRIGLQALLLPLGRLARKPDDARYAQLAGMIQNPGPVRDRLFAALPPTEASITRLVDALDAAEAAQRRLLQQVDAGVLKPGFPLEQIVEALRLNIVDAKQADALRAAYNLGEDWRLAGSGGAKR